MPDQTPQAVGRYFSSRLGAPVSVTGLRKTFPGISRETWLVRADVAGRAEGFVLRVDPPAGPSVPQPLSHEWEVYQRLWVSAVPVAEPLWFDADGAFAEGRPHMVRRLVEGDTSPPGILAQTAEGAERRRVVVREHVEKLALVHQLDWKAAGFDSFIPAPAGPGDALAAEFRTWKALWEARRTGPFPLVTEALGWLEENIPTDTPRISLVKGNNGIGEEIWRDDRIVAMSDWELASLGDGVLDLAFSQGTLDLDDFDVAVDHYGRLMGEAVSPQRIAFAIFWINFKALVCLNGYRLRPFLEGREDRVSALTHGILSVGALERLMARCIGRDLVEAWRDGRVKTESVYAKLGNRS